LKTTLAIRYTSPTTANPRARRLMRQPPINVKAASTSAHTVGLTRVQIP
jgi:hypothetical protein